MKRYANVYILTSPYSIDKPFSYEIPDGEAFSSIRSGSFVTVPFGRGDRASFGVVVGFDAPEENINVKPVLSVLDDRFSLSEEMLGLCLFLKERTLCTVGEAVRAAVPAPVFSFGKTRNLKTEKIYSLAIDENRVAVLLGETAGDEKPLSSEKQKSILRYLRENNETDATTLRAILDITGAQLDALTKKGLIAFFEREILRNPYALFAKDEDKSEIVLNRAQTDAFDTLSSLYGEEKANAALLYGVTGSGKTKVIMKLLDRAIKEGKTAIMLVPEIALTPQTVSIFCRRYGERVAVIHSSLSEGERFDAFRRISACEVDLVIGTRSAIFAPLKNIGIIVIDEEHEHTYKSEHDPKYHARDIAAYRASKNNALMLLASATPSLESFYKAKRGIYKLVELRTRYGGATLPEAEIIDMREEMRKGNTSCLSDALSSALAETVENDRQAIMLLNRRGYHSQLNCRECGHVLLCPQCSISLTFHNESGGGYLLCHLCGYRGSVPRECPECKSERLAFLGIGTQKAESELSSLLPYGRVMRMDADTTSRKEAYDAMLGAFRRKEADVLLGTQMVAKGHDFPLVTLVGVLLADSSLYMGDFRASEKTFSLLTQVIGRAGRAESGGRAIIQTISPENDVIRLACRQDYDSFYEREIALRKSLSFPPFCDIAEITLTSDDEEGLKKASEGVANTIIEKAKGDYKDQPMMIFGPFEAPTYKALGKYRRHIIIKCRLNEKTRALFSQLLCDYAREKGFSLSIDFNPI